jgi:hypothetical protein
MRREEIYEITKDWVLSRVQNYRHKYSYINALNIVE